MWLPCLRNSNLFVDGSFSGLLEVRVRAFNLTLMTSSRLFSQGLLQSRSQLSGSLPSHIHWSACFKWVLRDIAPSPSLHSICTYFLQIWCKCLILNVIHRTLQFPLLHLSAYWCVSPLPGKSTDHGRGWGRPKVLEKILQLQISALEQKPHMFHLRPAIRLPTAQTATGPQGCIQGAPWSPLLAPTYSRSLWPGPSPLPCKLAPHTAPPASCRASNLRGPSSVEQPKERWAHHLSWYL